MTGRQRAARRLLFITGSCVLFFSLPRVAFADDFADDKDARVVYCLSQAHRAELAGAAVSLGLAGTGSISDRIVVSGRETDLESWRRARATDFDRACTALYTASRQNGGEKGGGGLGIAAILMILLPVAAGAGLTVLTTDWRSARDQGRLRADALRKASQAYVQAASQFVRAAGEAGPRPGDEPVVRAQGDLDALLRQAEVLRPRWSAVGRLRDRLADEPLGSALTAGWAGLKAEERGARVTRIDAALDAVRDDCERVADALERPGRRHRLMKV